MGFKGKGKGSAAMQQITQVGAEKKCWVGGLPEGVDGKALQNHFVAYGAPKPVLADVGWKSSAVCTFQSAEDATAALAMNDTELNGATIQVDVWTQKKNPKKAKAAPKKNTQAAASKQQGKVASKAGAGSDQASLLKVFADFMKTKGKGQGKLAQEFLAGLTAKAKAPGAIQAAGSNTSAKAQLHEAKGVKKDAYEVKEAASGGYVATVTVEGKKFTGTPGTSKKEAENNAASVALGKKGGKQKTVAKAKAAKRKEPEKATNENPKNDFNHGVRLLLGRSVTKTDVTYDTAGDAETGFVSIVTVVELGKTFQGEAQPSTKLAEAAAAQVGLAAIKDEMEPLEAARIEQKKLKAQADREKQELKREAAKAAAA